MDAVALGKLRGAADELLTCPRPLQDATELNVEIDAKDDVLPHELKMAVRKQGFPVLHKALQGFIDGVHAESNAVNAALKEKDTTTDAQKAAAKEVLTSKAKNVEAPAAAAAAATASSGSGKGEGRSLVTIKEAFDCNAEDVFKVFTDVPRLQAFTRAPAEFRLEVGAPFALFGGSVRGKVVGFTAPSQLELEWAFTSWGGATSDVTFTFTQQGHGRTLVEIQQALPRGGEGGTIEEVKHGWMRNFLLPIKQVFGFGAVQGAGFHV